MVRFKTIIRGRHPRRSKEERSRMPGSNSSCQGESCRKNWSKMGEDHRRGWSWKPTIERRGRPAGEKLALLKRSLKGSCQDIVYGLGGGEEAYKEALIRLKETCGRRVVMRTVHIKTIDSLEPGQNPSSFKRNAEKIWTQLFDLTRSGKEWNLDIVERVCAQLNLQGRLALTEKKLDHTSLNEFERWLCKRATTFTTSRTNSFNQEVVTREEGLHFNIPRAIKGGRSRQPHERAFRRRFAQCVDRATSWRTARISRDSRRKNVWNICENREHASFAWKQAIRQKTAG